MRVYECIKQKNVDLEFIQNVIKEEIKTWNSDKLQMVEDLGEEEFLQEMSLEVLEFINNGDLVCSKEVILDYFEILTVDDWEDL